MSKKIVFALLGILASLAVVVPSFATGTTATYFLLPYILATPRPGVLLQNPTQESVTVMLNAFGHTGDLLSQILVTLSPSENKALFVGDIKEGLPKGTVAVRAESDAPLAGSTIFGTLEAPLAKLPSYIPVSQTLDFPYPRRQSDTWAAYFLLNPNAYSTSLTFRALDKDGGLLAERTIAPLSPLETRIALIEEIVDKGSLPFVATIRVFADSPIIGSVLIVSQEEGFRALPGLPFSQVPGEPQAPSLPREDEGTEPQERELITAEPSPGVSLCDNLGKELSRPVQFTVWKGKSCGKWSTSGDTPCDCTGGDRCSCLCTVPADTVKVGGSDCLGRCGRDCDDPVMEATAGAFVYTEACFIHDLCTAATENVLFSCGDEFSVASLDWGGPPRLNCSVTGLNATAASASQINLSWNDNFGESGFVIERAKASSISWTQIDRVGANATSYQDNDKSRGLTPGTRYTYRVQAYIDNNNGPRRSSRYSNVASATTFKTKTLTGVSTSGSPSVNRGACATYTATAFFSDGTSQNITSSATWSENSAYASISSGRLCVSSSLPSTQTVTVTASYTYNGTTKTGTKMVQIRR